MVLVRYLERVGTRGPDLFADQRDEAVDEALRSLHGDSGEFGIDPLADVLLDCGVQGLFRLRQRKK